MMVQPLSRTPSSITQLGPMRHVRANQAPLANLGRRVDEHIPHDVLPEASISGLQEAAKGRGTNPRFTSLKGCMFMVLRPAPFASQGQLQCF